MKKVLVICLLGFFTFLFTQLSLNEVRASGYYKEMTIGDPGDVRDGDITIENSSFLNGYITIWWDFQEDSIRLDKAPPASEVVDIWFSDVLKDDFCQSGTPLVVKKKNLKIKVDTSLKGTFITYTKEYRNAQHATKVTLMVPSEEIKKQWEDAINKKYSSYLTEFNNARKKYLDALEQKEKNRQEKEEKRNKALTGELIVMPRFVMPR